MDSTGDQIFQVSAVGGTISEKKCLGILDIAPGVARLETSPKVVSEDFESSFIGIPRR